MDLIAGEQASCDTSRNMDIDKILAGTSDLTVMRLERDTLASDLKTIKSSLISLAGHRSVRALSKIDKQPDVPQPQTPTQSTNNSVDEAAPIDNGTLVPEKSPSPQPATKAAPTMPSILVQPEGWRPSQNVKAAEEERQAILESQRSDQQAMSRNKRMFGMLMGTLHRFKVEETNREPVTKKRYKIEEKLESAVEEERVSATKEVARLTELKQSKEHLLSRIEHKIDLVERFKNWDKSHRHLSKFIRTDTKPKICWLPREHTSETEQKQRETRDYWGLCCAEKMARFKRDLEEVDGSIKECSESHSKLIDNNNTNQDC